MSNPDKPDYTHGSNGTKPSNSVDYTNGDPLDADNLDYFINTPFEKIRAIIDRLVAIDSDGDGKVDAADTADDATNVTSTYKGNDIDSDGDGKVNSANSADTATTVKGNDIDSDGDGKVDSADVADNATAYKNNDIDSDGDGTVDSADFATSAGDSIDPSLPSEISYTEGTWKQNTTGRPNAIYATMESNYISEIVLHINDTQTNNAVSVGGFNDGTNAETKQGTFGIVPDGTYWKVSWDVKGSGSVDNVDIYEQSL